jgi:glucose/arabinose dehydrogenase
LEYFDSNFLVALHGSTKKRLRRGYRVVRVPESGGPMQDFITGFFESEKINGRPADIFNFGRNAFLLTDDYSGVVYYVYKKS